MFETFHHTADVGLRVRAGTLNELFSDAGRALFSLLVANLDDVRPVEEVTLHVEGHEPDYLLVDWLSELLYTFESRQLVLCRFAVEVNDDGLTAHCHGERVDRNRHQMDHEVKAITYHGLRVEQLDDGYLAEVIVDI